MSMRVTQSMISARQLTAVQRSSDALADATLQASTQKRINAPSDDPTGTSRALALRDSLAALDGHDAAVGTATNLLGTAATALRGVSDALQRVRELTVRGANGTTTDQGRQAIAVELRSIVDSVKDQANAAYDGTYVFAGTASDAKPYGSSSDAFGGSGGVLAQQVGPSTSVQANPVNGGELFGSASGDGKVLDVLRTIIGHLDAGDVGSLGTTDLAALSRVTDAVGVASTTVGGVQQRVDAASSRIASARVTATKALSGIEDVDLAGSLVKLTNQQTAYQAALKSTAAIVSTSLMDFMS